MKKLLGPLPCRWVNITNRVCVGMQAVGLIYLVKTSSGGGIGAMLLLVGFTVMLLLNTLTLSTGIRHD